MSVLDGIANWRFGIDFGIASAGAQPQFVEADFMLSDFKWSEMLQAAAPTYASGTRIGHIQAHYIASVLMISYLRVAIGHSVEPETMGRVLCSFPMSFSIEDVKILTAALEAACEVLKRRTGLTWDIALGADESTAAAANAGTLSTGIFVYLDMGGGSTDVAVKFKRGRDAHETVYLSSVRYAGMALLHAFEGEGTKSTCLTGKTTVDVLRRRVREARSVKELFGDPTLFSKHEEMVRRNRVLHFYGYVIELAARMIAAGFLDQRFMVEGEDGTRSFPSELPIAVFFLGNGWRFQGSVADDFESSLSTDMWKRTLELLREEKSPYALSVMKALKGVKLSQEAMKLDNIPHEKAAVAVGLLSKAAADSLPPNAKADAMRPKASSILGWNTKVNGKREIPWFAMYRAGATEKPPGLHSNPHKDDASSTVIFGDPEPAGPATGLEATWYDEDLPANPTLDWGDTAPRMPRVVESPFELDKNLNHTRHELQRQCHNSKQQKWFAKGPYEVLLEELFKIKLRTIGA